MRIRLLTGTALVACLALGAGSTALAAINDPPRGIVPTTATLDEVLKRSAFTDDANAPNPRIEDWNVTTGGLQGTEHIVHSGLDYTDATQLGPFAYASGRSDGQEWRQTENGFTILLDGLHERDHTSEVALHDAGLGKTTGSAVTLVGETVAPVPCYVVEVKPPNGRHEWVFYDKATSFIDRIESVEKDVRVTETYDDYRKTNGFFRPWHIHSSDGRPGNDEDDRLISETAPSSISPAELAIPGNRRTIDVFPDGVHRVDLPSRMIGGAVVIRVNIGGRGLDFQLDSGADGIYIDAGVAAQLGLTTYGRTTGAAAGQFSDSQTIVPEMDVGSIALHRVVVQSVPFNYAADDRTRIVGLLGFDFIADTTLKIDYLGGHVTALDELPTKQLPSDTIQLPLTLDDEVPVVDARVGDAAAKFLIDTGSADLVLFPDFAEAHPDQVRDQGYGKLLSMVYPEISVSGVGGTFVTKPIELDKFSFGRVAFRDILAFLPQNAPSFDVEDTAGLIGYPILQTFDVWFDYRSGNVFLAPNAAARKYLKPI